MMRTILFVNFLQETRQLRSIVKQIPYAPEDSEMYFIDISTADKEKLGVDALSYLNNHYEDDTPCVWLMQPVSHRFDPYAGEVYAVAVAAGNAAAIPEPIPLAGQGDHRMRQYRTNIAA